MNGKWQILKAGTVRYRSTNSPDYPEQSTGWAKISLDQGTWNWETQQYDIVETESPRPGLSISASYGLVPGFRRAVTAFFDGIISMNNPYPKAWKFKMRRSLAGWDGAVWQPAYATITMGTIKAMNPAHIIYECFTNREWGRGMSRDLIDDASFTAAAIQLFNEGFGLCIKWSRTDSIDNFVQLVLNHIGAATYTSRQTGLIKLQLIRGGYDFDDLPLFTPDTGLLSVQDGTIASIGASVNEVQVTYHDPLSDEDQVVKVSNLAAIQASGGVINSTSKEYMGVPTSELAYRIAQRDLRASSVNLRKYTVKLDRRGRVVEPGSVFLIEDPSRAIPRTPVRAGGVTDGTATDGAITVAGIQDVFELPQVSWAVKVPNTWQPPDMSACLDIHKVFEVPYFMLAGNLRRADLAYVDENDGFIAAVCGQGKKLNAGYRIAVRSGASTPDDIPTGTDYFCGYTP